MDIMYEASLSEISDESLNELCCKREPGIDSDCNATQPHLLEDPVVSSDLLNQLNGLQENWIRFHDQSKKKILANATQKLLSHFNAEREVFRMELLTEMKEKMEKEKTEYEYQLKQKLEHDLASFEVSHCEAIFSTKKRQWCKVCFKEAIYGCCWNTSYCSVECQGRHWLTHMANCRRVKE